MNRYTSMYLINVSESKIDFIVKVYSASAALGFNDKTRKMT